MIADRYSDKARQKESETACLRVSRNMSSVCVCVCVCVSVCVCIYVVNVSK